MCGRPHIARLDLLESSKSFDLHAELQSCIFVPTAPNPRADQQRSAATRSSYYAQIPF